MQTNSQIRASMNEAVIAKISIFQEIAPQFTLSQKNNNFLSIIGIFRPTASTL